MTSELDLDHATNLINLIGARRNLEAEIDEEEALRQLTEARRAIWEGGSRRDDERKSFPSE